MSVICWMARKCAMWCCIVRKNGALFICAQVLVMIRSSACCGLHQRGDELHLTFLDVRNGTLQMIIRRDLRDDHQEVEPAVVEVLRAAGRRRGQPGAGLSAQSLHVCRFHQGSHPVSLTPTLSFSPLCPVCAPSSLLPFIRRRDRSGFQTCEWSFDRSGPGFLYQHTLCHSR